jgi:SapC protein
MTRHVLLNNVAHKNLRVITRHGERYGENVGSVLAFPTEFGDLQREYPIFFRKDAANGEYQSIALLGFAKDENLFLDGDRWDARYLPGIVARGPFLIGFQERETREPVIHVDLDDPRVSETEGEPVFLPHGGNSHYLERIATTLSGLHEGMAVSRAMFAAFDEFNLIEPVKIEVKLGPDEQYDLVGLYTISEEKLRGLDGEALVKLNRAGFLQGAFLVVASLNNMKKLIDMKHRKRSQQTGATA